MANTSVLFRRLVIRLLISTVLLISLSSVIVAYEYPDAFVRMLVDTVPPACSATDGYRLSWQPPAPARPPRIDLSTREEKHFSQAGEAGVINALFEVIEPRTKFAVEFGAMDGVEASLTRHLIVDKGWSAYLIEGEPALAEALQNNYRDFPRVRTQQAWVFPGSIEILFEDNDVPSDLDSADHRHRQ